MNYVEVIENSTYLKEFFEFIFKTDVASTYKRLREYGAVLEFEFESDIRYIDRFHTDPDLDALDPLVRNSFYYISSIPGFLYIHSALSDTQNFCLKFNKIKNADFIDYMIRCISAFSVVHKLQFIVDTFSVSNIRMIHASMKWVRDTDSYGILDNIEEYATHNNIFDELLTICDELDDMTAKMILLNAHNKNPDAYKSESLVL